MDYRYTYIKTNITQVNYFVTSLVNLQYFCLKTSISNCFKNNWLIYYTYSIIESKLNLIYVSYAIKENYSEEISFLECVAQET